MYKLLKFFFHFCFHFFDIVILIARRINIVDTKESGAL